MDEAKEGLEGRETLTIKSSTCGDLVAPRELGSE